MFKLSSLCYFVMAALKPQHRGHVVLSLHLALELGTPPSPTTAGAAMLNNMTPTLARVDGELAFETRGASLQ